MAYPSGRPSFSRTTNRLGPPSLPPPGGSNRMRSSHQVRVRPSMPGMPRRTRFHTRGIPGMLGRTRTWWELRILFEPPGGGSEGGPKRFVVLEKDGRPEGYAIYRHKPKWENGVSNSELEVIEAIAYDGRPTAELWRYLFDIDWAA